VAANYELRGPAHCAKGIRQCNQLHSNSHRGQAGSGRVLFFRRPAYLGWLVAVHEHDYLDPAHGPGAIGRIRFGHQPLSRGGFAGSQVVRSAGTAIGTTVSNGGMEVVSSGGTTSGTLLSGGQEILSRGGRSSGTDILSGGDEIVSSGGSALST
jgi:autotransporter passenger strand-loop-strand repeat protein